MSLLQKSTGLLQQAMQAVRGEEGVPDAAARLSNGSFPEVRVALIGAGKIAPEHLKVLHAFDDVAIVGIANRGNSDLTPLAQEFDIQQTFSDWELMLDTVQPDAVLILVSHFKTVDITAECIRRGIPSLIEKPAGFTSVETAQLAALAEEHGVLNMVAVNRRYYSGINHALRIIRARGPLMGVQIEAPEAIRRIRRESRHGQELIDRWLVANSIHAVDLFRHIGGDVTEVQSMIHAWEEPHADSFSATMRYESGALGTFVAHWQSVPGWRLGLYGDGVKAIFQPFERPVELNYGRGRVEKIPVDPVDQQFKPGFYGQLRAFIDAIVYEEPLAPPASDLRDAVKTMQLIERIGQLEPVQA